MGTKRKGAGECECQWDAQSRLYRARWGLNVIPCRIRGSGRLPSGAPNHHDRSTMTLPHPPSGLHSVLWNTYGAWGHSRVLYTGLVCSWIVGQWEQVGLYASRGGLYSSQTGANVIRPLVLDMPDTGFGCLFGHTSECPLF